MCLTVGDFESEICIYWGHYDPNIFYQCREPKSAILVIIFDSPCESLNTSYCDVLIFTLWKSRYFYVILLLHY